MPPSTMAPSEHDRQDPQHPLPSLPPPPPHEANRAHRRKHLDPQAYQRSRALAQACRARVLSSVERIAENCRHDDGRLGILLSGGVDSTALLEALWIARIPLVAAVTVSIVAKDGDSEDEANTTIPQDELYAIEAVRHYNERRRNGTTEPPLLRHSIVRRTPADLVEAHSRRTIETLAVWGSMETRNSLLMRAALEECQRLGLTDVVTGDNADELLGGSYDWYFSSKHAREGWIEKRNATANLPFATNRIAATFSTLKLHQPFRDEALVRWATTATAREDCIDVHGCCALQSECGGPYLATHHNCGKLPLREAFDTVASWRTMDWIFSGSGGTALVDYYETLYEDEEFETEQARYLLEAGIRVASKEHLHNLGVYQRVFGGLHYHPTKERFPAGDPRGCVDCGFDHGREAFCHLCDAYPAQHPPATKV